MAKSRVRSARVLRRGPSRPSATPRQPALSPVAATASFLYIESSGLLAALLEHDPSARTALRGPWRRITSALTLAEASRGVLRARLTGRLTSEEERAAIRALKTFERRCTIVSITESVLTRAGRPFPVEPIRTLDAIHLATAELLGEPPQLITVLTRDTRVRENAEALGYVVA